MSITNYTKFVDEYNLLHTNKLPKNQYAGSKDNKFVLIFLGKPGAGKGTQLQYMFDRGSNCFSYSYSTLRINKNERKRK